MLQIRVIPCLLLLGEGLVKTTRFKDPVYVGDPINAIRIFNDKEVDELIFLDITASREGRGPAFQAIRDFASECFMPVGYGGGIRSLEEARQVLSMGIEKIILNTMALRRPELVSEIAREFGADLSVGVRESLSTPAVGDTSLVRAGWYPRWNMAPSSRIVMVALASGAVGESRVVEYGRWGLVP
jgi:cyclase